MKNNIIAALDKANKFCEQNFLYPIADSNENLRLVLKSLESVYPTELTDYLKQEGFEDSFLKIKEEVLNTLKKEGFSYSLIPETNRFFIKQQDKIVKNVQFQNIDQILSSTIKLESSHKHFHILKLYFLAYSRFEFLLLKYHL